MIQNIVHRIETSTNGRQYIHGKWIKCIEFNLQSPVSRVMVQVEHSGKQFWSRQRILQHKLGREKARVIGVTDKDDETVL